MASIELVITGLTLPTPKSCTYLYIFLDCMLDTNKLKFKVGERINLLLP